MSSVDHVILATAQLFPETGTHFKRRAVLCECLFILFLLQAIVFIVGGGDYIEYQNLQDYSKVNHNCDIICGGSMWSS